MSGAEATELAEPAWSKERLNDPHAVADKRRRVQDMFAAIARSYDLNNRIHSFGRDQAWRDAAVAMAAVRRSDAVADVACGTGDLALKFAAATDGPVVGVDFTLPMLPLAATKDRGHGVAWVNGDAQALPLADASVDVVSIAFGLRNVADPAAAVAEFHRVLRPGGRLVVLEFTVPRNPLARWGSRFYTDWLMPRTATLISGDRSGAYRYLPRSVATFLDRAGVERVMREAGFDGVRSRSLTMGVAACYVGVR